MDQSQQSGTIFMRCHKTLLTWTNRRAVAQLVASALLMRQKRFKNRRRKSERLYCGLGCIFVQPFVVGWWHFLGTCTTLTGQPSEKLPAFSHKKLAQSFVMRIPSNDLLHVPSTYPLGTCPFTFPLTQQNALHRHNLVIRAHSQRDSTEGHA